MKATPTVPDDRCADCRTAKPPAGAIRCQACRMMRILGCPVIPYVPTTHKENATR